MKALGLIATVLVLAACGGETTQRCTVKQDCGYGVATATFRVCGDQDVTNWVGQCNQHSQHLSCGSAPTCTCEDAPDDACPSSGAELVKVDNPPVPECLEHSDCYGRNVCKLCENYQCVEGCGAGAHCRGMHGEVPICCPDRGGSCWPVTDPW